MTPAEAKEAFERVCYALRDAIANINFSRNYGKDDGRSQEADAMACLGSVRSAAEAWVKAARIDQRNQDAQIAEEVSAGARNLASDDVDAGLRGSNDTRKIIVTAIKEPKP